ncbi:hypothetical protein ACKI2N_030050 [Cupriavidus sp. 30B13]|uniref:hypothetical protein n=1 Tax=Cupriavidus sp. 30B13 TaxID=3384241 RepID=UPI003B908D74
MMSFLSRRSLAVALTALPLLLAGCAALMPRGNPGAPARRPLAKRQFMNKPFPTRRPPFRMAACVAVISLLSTPDWANATPDEALFRVFSSCDQSFFEKLHAEKPQWSGRMTLSTGKGIAYPAVENRRYERINWQALPRPLIVGGVKLVAYHDAKDEFPGPRGLSKRVFWGFLAEGEPAELAEKLKPFVQDAERLRPATGVDWPAWIRGEFRLSTDLADGQWEKAEIPLGEVPKAGTVERILLIEPTETGPGLKLVSGMSTVECSLQGDFAPALLQRLRPDLDDAEIADW